MKISKKMLVAMILSGLFTACSDVKTQTVTQENQDDLSENTKKTYLIAVEASYPPYAFRNELGHVEGYDADILKAIGQVQGFDIKLLNQQWEGIFDTLDNDSRHLVASGARYTKERAQKMEASDPVATAKSVLFVLDKNISSLDDLKNKKISVQTNSSAVKDITKMTEGKNIEIKEFESLYLALKAVLNGKSDAVYGESSVVSHFINNMPKEHQTGFQEVDIGRPTNHIVYYMKKGNVDFLNHINTGLKKIKMNGEYQKINQKWFGKPDTFVSPTSK